MQGTSPAKRALGLSATPPPSAKKARCSHSTSTPLNLSAAGAASLIPALVSPTTADEVEQFLKECVKWQTNLAVASRAVEATAAQLDRREVALVLNRVVGAVELRAREESVAQREAELEVLLAAVAHEERTLERTLVRIQQEQKERDAFETLERRVLDDRVAELEVQLTQNKLREVEKDDAITKLRAEQDALSATSCGVSTSERDAHLTAHQRLGDEADAWRRQYEAQTHIVAALHDEFSVSTLTVQVLEGQLALARAQDETRAFEDVEKRILEERVDELTAQLQTQRAASERDEKEQQQEHETLTAALEAAQLQLRVAEAEATVKKNEVSRLLRDKAALKQHAKALAVELQKAKAADLGRRRTDVAAVHQERVSGNVQQAPIDGLLTATDARETEADARVAQLELEKREILHFFQCYYDASETKCQELLRELVSQKEAAPICHSSG